MIELTGALQQAVEDGQDLCEAVDPRTKTRYIVVRADLFEHLRALAYDDSPWTDEEKSLLAAESGQSIGWNEMNEYDDYDRNKP
ncbi:MAG: hypothetical protein NTY19_05585 [Planctomycetota bacterium]|nr:hypothetical protein [Planctomycetota bacterium]